MSSSPSYQQPRLVCALATHTRSVAVVSDLARRWREGGLDVECIICGSVEELQERVRGHEDEAIIFHDVSLSGAIRYSVRGSRRHRIVPSWASSILWAVGVNPAYAIQPCIQCHICLAFGRRFSSQVQQGDMPWGQAKRQRPKPPPSSRDRHRSAHEPAEGDFSF